MYQMMIVNHFCSGHCLCCYILKKSVKLKYGFLSGTEGVIIHVQVQASNNHGIFDDDSGKLKGRWNFNVILKFKNR